MELSLSQYIFLLLLRELFLQFSNNLVLIQLQYKGDSQLPLYLNRFGMDY